MVDISNSNKIRDPWPLRPKYPFTSKLLNSSAPIARVAKYTGVTLAVLAIAWGVAEIGLAISDAYSTGSTLLDPNASGGEKALFHVRKYN